MALETELKLRVAPEHMARLKRCALLRKLSISRAATHRVYSVYHDTPDLALQRQAMALRFRRIGRQWLQTLKAGGSVRAGLHHRNEWETPVAGEALDWAALKACGAEGLSGSVRKRLQPLFVTDFSRTTRRLSFGSAEIVLCLDSGEIRAGDAVQPISEVELELKSGEPEQLFKLAQVLLHVAPMEIEHVSKAGYGYRLATRLTPKVAKAVIPSLTHCADVPAALHAMVNSCLHHLHANVPGVLQRLDEEYLHQVRVALRRLLVVLKMAESYRPDAELGRLSEQTARFCTRLGRLREWDVFVTQTLAPACTHMQVQAGLSELLQAGEARRAHCQSEVEHGLQSIDYQRFQLDMGAWMHGAYWRTLSIDGLPLPRFALQILDRHAKNVTKRGKGLAAAEPLQLHRLRIACKKLRYSAEIFASLGSAGQTKRYLAALSALQEILGALNDIAVAHRLLDDLVGAGHAQAAAVMRDRIEHNAAEQRAKLVKAWKKFSKLHHFRADLR
jgi:inorganic triphosphatase YgiF